MNKYLLGIGISGSYGHKFKLINLEELVDFDGVVLMDGVRYNYNSSVYFQWNTFCN